MLLTYYYYFLLHVFDECPALEMALDLPKSSDKYCFLPEFDASRNSPSRIIQRSDPKINYSLYSRHYGKACNEWREPSSRLSAWGTQLRRNVAAVASRWRHCVRFDRPGNRNHSLSAVSSVFKQSSKPNGQFTLQSIQSGEN